MEITIGGHAYEIEYTTDPDVITDAILAEEKLKWCVYDCEATGLHIKKDRPFLGALLFNDKVYAFPTTKEIMEHFPNWVRNFKRTYGQNITYDMHMLANIMQDDWFPLKVKNWGDTMGLCRLAFEAISTRDGGDSLKLKEIGDKYIDKNASQYEKAVKAWLHEREADNFKVLVTTLQGMFGKKGWSITAINSMLNIPENIPEEAIHIFEHWKEAYPVPNYQDVPMEIMLPYLCVDVILCDRLVVMSSPVIYHKQQQEVMEREFKLLTKTYKMERRGLPTDRQYLLTSKVKMEHEIKYLNEKMWAAAGEKWGQFSCNQHALIKKIYAERLGYIPESTDKQFLVAMKNNGDDLAAIIGKLRRLDKWQSTYLDRILEISEYDGRFYVTMNQFIPISGRYSGDAQQFPKERILTEAGDLYEKEHGKGSAPIEYEIFYPRRAFTVNGGKFKRNYYLDYSQVELRVTGHYTLYYGGDVNLCRAYMPFQCVHYRTKQPYEHETFQGRKRWTELQEGSPDGRLVDVIEKGWSVWIVPETELPWQPTDVHSATMLKALPLMGIDVKTLTKVEIKYWRDIAKRFNFMRNYGGGDKKASEVLEILLEHAKAMNRGFSASFPKILTYQKDVEREMYQKGYVHNLYNRRYYLADASRFYKCGNYLIQGTATGDLLKMKIIEIDDWLVDNGCESYLYLNVHDEVQLALADGEEWIIEQLKNMMEDTPEINIPIVVEIEYTTTTWAEKRAA